MASLSKNNVDNSVFGEVRPSAKIRDVLKTCERECSMLGPQDHVVIMGGANDIAKNETKNCINTLKRTLSALTSTNVVVLIIPTRHDLITESIVNKEIRKANIDIYKISKRLKNVKVLDISNICREYHTRHGSTLTE
jgi:lysophospholipase L1-like esterase